MSGTDTSGNPVRSTEISQCKPVLHDDRRVFTHNDLAGVCVSPSSGTDGYVDGRKRHEFSGLAEETGL